MPVELMAAAFIIAFAAIVVLGHVLVVAAIYKCLREDYAGGRTRSATSDTTMADDRAKRAASAATLSDTLQAATGSCSLGPPAVKIRSSPRRRGPRAPDRGPGSPLARE